MTILGSKILHTDVVDIGECARCGGNHDKIPITQFYQPAIDSTGVVWTHWGSCPETKEPILIRLTNAQQ